MFELEQELDIPSDLRWHNSAPKESSLEEALKKYVTTMSLDQSVYIDFLQCAEFGAKWEREQNSLTPSDLIEFSKWINKMGYAHRLKLIPDDLIDFYLKNKENITKLNLE
jgi:hypothetical protein